MPNYKKIGELIPYFNNPRNNDAAVDKVAESISQFGFQNPIIIDKENVVIAGHTRLKAAEKLGLDEIPVIVADLTDDQARAYRLVDNKTAEFSEWDFEKLAEELNGIDLDLSAFDFSFDELDVSDLKEIIEDEPPEVDEESEPVAKLGNVWKLGEHRLICGDSTDAATIEKLMDGQKADLVFTDPPWNVNYGDIDENNAQGYKPRKILNDYMPAEDFKNFMFAAFKNMKENTVDGGMVYVVMSAQEWGNLMLTLAENGFHWSSTIIWNKDRLVLSRKDYHTKYEPIWYGWKDGAARVHPLEDRTQADVWDIERPSKSELHPTTKPVELVARAIKNSSRKNDICIDLFGGSGTTLIACEQLNRRCYMAELDPRYCDVIIKRWETLTGKKAEIVKN